MLEVGLFVGPLLLFLMFTIARGCIGVAVRGRMGVKNPDTVPSISKCGWPHILFSGCLSTCPDSPISCNVRIRHVPSPHEVIAILHSLASPASPFHG